MPVPRRLITDPLHTDLCNPYQSNADGGLLTMRSAKHKLDQETRIPAFVTMERRQL